MCNKAIQFTAVYNRSMAGHWLIQSLATASESFEVDLIGAGRPCSGRDAGQCLEAVRFVRQRKWNAIHCHTCLRMSKLSGVKLDNNWSRTPSPE